MKNKQSVFEGFFSSLTTNIVEGIEPSEIKEEKSAELPPRLYIIANGFVKKWNSEEVNRQLLENDCEPLYARSFYEAGLIYAFDHGMNYAQWKEFYEKYRNLLQEEKCNEDSCFSGGKITLKQLERYVYSESDEELQTELLTRWLEKEIKEKSSEEEYQDFVKENIQKFSAVRERARYYFCKYIYLYIQDKCQKYYESCEKTEHMLRAYESLQGLNECRNWEKDALGELTFLKPLTKLKRDADKVKNKMSLEEKKEYLENTALTPGGIFDQFNNFYYEYISTEWLDVLFEFYGEVDEWPTEMKIRIARSLKLCKKNSTEEEVKEALIKLEQMEAEQRQKEEENGSREKELKKKIYQRGRSGEDFFREFITGSRDINRETLLSFLLFVKMQTSLDEDNKITKNRLSRILKNCGFAQLRPNKEFDKFVLDFLSSKDPMGLLVEEVDRYARKGQDFYLYKVYKESYCHQKELLTYICGN